MPHLNLDEQKSLFEPIEITLEGKKYIVKKISSNIMKQTDELAKNKKDTFGLVKQFALLTNTKTEELADIDVRKLGEALKFIMNEITKQFKVTAEKNASKAEGKK